MKLLRGHAALLLVLAVAMSAFTEDKKLDDPKKDDGFVPMFNGKDLTGWVNVNCAPGTFFVKNHEIITTGKPTGYLRTAKQYENFIAEFEWMHVPPKPDAVGNSGFFVWADALPAVGTGYTRGIEVQVLVNLEYKNKKGQVTASSHGDLFSIWGAKCVPDRPHPDGWERCLPSENRARGPGEWNHYRVEANDGVIKLAVNGKVVSGVSKCSPRKGYLALESEGSECHFRNLKIKELPSTNPKPEECAEVAQGHVNLFTGLDLSGWEAREQWTPRDGVLHAGGSGRALYTKKEYGEAEFIVDFRFPKEGRPSIGTFVFRQDTRTSANVSVSRDGKMKVTVALEEVPSSPFKDLNPAGEWNRLQATLKGKSLKVNINGKPAAELDITALAATGKFGVFGDGEMDFRSLFVRELDKKE